MKKSCPGSLRASSLQFGDIVKSRHARGTWEETRMRGAGDFAALARLASLAQIGELARILFNSRVEGSLANPSSPGTSLLLVHFLTKRGELLTWETQDTLFVIFLIVFFYTLNKWKLWERFTSYFHSCPVVSLSGSKKAEESKPKKPLVVLSLDTSKVKPQEAKVLNALSKVLEDLLPFWIMLDGLVG